MCVGARSGVCACMSVIVSAAYVCVLGRLPEECTPASTRLTVSRHPSFRTLTRILVAFTTAYRGCYPFLRLFCVCCRCCFDSHFFGVSCDGLCPPHPLPLLSAPNTRRLRWRALRYLTSPLFTRSRPASPKLPPCTRRAVSCRSFFLL